MSAVLTLKFRQFKSYFAADKFHTSSRSTPFFFALGARESVTESSFDLNAESKIKKLIIVSTYYGRTNGQVKAASAFTGGCKHSFRKPTSRAVNASA
jgi:hypothetical protein